MTIPEPAGLIDGKLRPCPNSPNCVCSEFTEVEHAIEPLVISSDPIEAWSRLLDILNELPRTTIVRFGRPRKSATPTLAQTADESRQSANGLPESELDFPFGS